MEEFKQINQNTINQIYALPFFDLLVQAQSLHSKYHNRQEIQACHLISIKTGGCPEDCKYCSQSSSYETGIRAQPLLEIDEVIQKAKKAIEKGVTRICLGAAWREVRDSPQFERVLTMISTLKDLGVEVCCTLGMLKDHQAKKLKEAGLYAYNS